MTGPPYVSDVKLFENSNSAMLSAIELFNRPRILLRERRYALISAAVTGTIDLTNKGVTA